MTALPEAERRGNDLLPVAGAVLFALALRAAFFSGLTGYDEFAYARIAGDISGGLFSFKDVTGYYGFRYLVTFPAAAFMKFFGPGGLAAAAWPLLCSLGNTALAYLLAKEMFGRRAGILAAFFQACLPVSVVYGTMLYPDEILVFWTGLAALMFLKGERCHGGGGGTWFFALSGLFAGLGWHARLNSAVILPVFALWALRSGPRPAHLAAAAGFLAALLPDWAAGAALAGDPFFSLRAQLAKLSSDTGVYPGGHFIYLRGLSGLDLYGLALFGFYSYFAAAAVLAAARSRELGQLFLPLAWVLVIFLYLEFGPASLSPYRPVHKQLRFLSMFFFPVLAITARLVSSWGFRARAAAVFFLVATSVGGAWKMSAYRAAEAQPWRTAAAYLESRSPARVFVSGVSGHYLAYYLGDKTPYYKKPGSPEGKIVRLEKALPADLAGSCAALPPAGPGSKPEVPAGLRREFSAAESLAVPEGPVIYCFN